MMMCLGGSVEGVPRRGTLRRCYGEVPRRRHPRGVSQRRCYGEVPPRRHPRGSIPEEEYSGYPQAHLRNDPKIQAQVRFICKPAKRLMS